MQSKHLNVTHVLMAADPSASHWHPALTLAEALAEHGVRSTIACLSTPSATDRERAGRVPGIDLRMGPGTTSIEWTLFLEMLAEPDIVQLFVPEHVLMPWRSPLALRVSDDQLRKPSKELLEATENANLVLVEDAVQYDRLQSLLGRQAVIAALPVSAQNGWDHFLAYEEIIQGVLLDLGDHPGDRFELV